MPTKPEDQARIEQQEAQLQTLAELHRNGAEVFQAALEALTVTTTNLAHVAIANAQRDQPPPDTRTLDQRMAAVQLELEDVPRKGHAKVTTNSGATYEYDYITEADLMTGIRPLLAKHGIASYYSDRIVSIDRGEARVEVSLTLAADGEQRILTAEGIGTDRGDKHANKAKTSAMRYLLWKTFLQPSDEDDPEQENVSREEARGAHEGRQRAAEQRQGRTTQRRGQKTPEQIHGELISRITTLAVELDEVQGRTPGTTQGKLYDDVYLAADLQLPELNGAALVEIGKKLSAHVAAQREIAEKGGDASAEFSIPQVA